MPLDEKSLTALAGLFRLGGDLMRLSAECSERCQMTSDAHYSFKKAAELYAGAADVIEEIRDPIFETWLEDRDEDEDEDEEYDDGDEPEDEDYDADG